MIKKRNQREINLNTLRLAHEEGSDKTLVFKFFNKKTCKGRNVELPSVTQKIFNWIIEKHKETAKILADVCNAEVSAPQLLKGKPTVRWTIYRYNSNINIIKFVAIFLSKINKRIEKGE